jgi:methylamine dehydrogenase heavy chain
MSPDKKTFYVTTTYYDRGTRGNRADVVEMWDVSTLSYQGEVVIPNKHAEASSYPGLVSTTQDGRYLFVQNATPASSIAVVDTVKKKLAFELGTAGCWTAWPAPSRDDRITTICGDGAFLTLTFNQKGNITESKRSAPIFDPDSDPMFVQGAVTENGKVLFISFHGKLRTVDVSGQVAATDGAEWSIIPQSLLTENWRPGGYQMLAYHKKSGRLFVLMHKNGKEGSHKFPADEIWEIDPVHQQVVQRIAGNGAIAMTITQDDHPKILCANIKGELLVYSVEKNVVFERAIPQAANTSTEVLAP